MGTKSDLTAEREVDNELIKSLAARWGLPFYETSAKRNWHVNSVFEEVVRQMRERIPVEPTKRKERDHKCIIM